MNNGFILLHRRLTKHWIYNNNEYFAAWIKMLMEVNHSDAKVLIKGELIECRRGQSLRSLKSWAELFGRPWTVRKIRTFFKVLKSDTMIDTQSVRKTTRLTVCNYDTYNSLRQANDTQTVMPNDKQTTSKRQQTTRIKKNKQEYTSDFEAAWIGYNRKGNKAESFSEWLKLSEEDHKVILERIPLYVASKSEEKYQLDFQRYISAKKRKWEDKIIMPTNKDGVDPKDVNNFF